MQPIVTSAPPRRRGLLTGVLAFAGVAAFAIMFSTTLLGVIARYFEFGGVEWSFEVASIAFVWITFVGLLNAELRGENVAFEALNQASPPLLKRCLDFIAALALFAMGAAFLVSGWAVWQRSAMVPTAVLRLPSGVVTIPVIILGIGAVVIAARRFTALTVSLRQREGVRA
ncbi:MULTISPECIES: TRAP transporter small permease subunit [unclassified Sinorhizobium]|uniref:TRAP transporter small permease n=1 Tax=unclassified Sinorhizobium TaxID=2613772 RepID=UPI0024C221CB|nr:MULTISPECIES: TRAP transporter small permease subunit [unclassified Sinorhizobium]MDK1378239.1 TRAP transporter small permease subunit [Sinorhizobium sp. 6-70]MDK1480378.1 TRAP transporter small permease subunit [Sinorhizobium sp. 6-117]